MNDYVMNRESLKQHCEAMCKKFKDVPTSGTYGASRLVLDLLEQTEWIPCSERLPERDTNVLAYHKNESFEYVYVSWIDDYTGKWAGFIGNFPDDVLAWMPLPEPYKEGEET